VRAVWEGAKSVGCRLNDAALRWKAPNLVSRLETLRADLKEVKRRTAAIAQRLPGYPGVISIPGVGPVLAAMILAAVGDPQRFQHPKQVLRPAGLDLWDVFGATSLLFVLYGVAGPSYARQAWLPGRGNRGWTSPTFCIT